MCGRRHPNSIGPPIVHASTLRLGPVPTRHIPIIAQAGGGALGCHGAFRTCGNFAYVLTHPYNSHLPSPPANPPTRRHFIMSDSDTFLFTSESVGEGHPGECPHRGHPRVSHPGPRCLASANPLTRGSNSRVPLDTPGPLSIGIVSPTTFAPYAPPPCSSCLEICVGPLKAPFPLFARPHISCHDPPFSRQDL